MLNVEDKNEGTTSVAVSVRLIERLPETGALLETLDRPGAALLSGWSDDEPWTILLPWPEEIRELSWNELANWRSVIRSLESETIEVDPLPEAPFLGGWVGQIAYELGAVEEGAPLPDEVPPEPPLWFVRHRSGVVSSSRGTWLFGPEGQLDDLEERLGQLRSQEAAPTAPIAPMEVHDSLAGTYRSRVEEIREAISWGDVYQINLTRRFETGPVDPVALHRALIGAEPPRCSAFLRGEGWAIASASPEVFLRFDRKTGVAESRPIKGTVRRSSSDDRSEIDWLLASGKDAAEHLMIVDLVRNDLGKVAHRGRVSVPHYRTVRTLAHLHHLESTVRAEGLEDVRLDELLGALFPAGSITGAPKRAAVGMIRKLEPVARGVYTGAIGLIDQRGRTELSVAIRTAVVTPSSARYHAGGGIVWESDPASEDDESIAKSSAFLRFARGEP